MTLRLLFLLLTFSVNSIAQDTERAFRPRRLLLKWNPLTLFDTESMIQPGLEYFLSSRTAVQVEAGYGPLSLDRLSLFKQGKLDERQAWRVRSEFRFYRRPGTKMGRYWALEGFFMTVNGLKSVFISTFEGGRDEPVAFPIHKCVVGGHLKMGIQQAFGRKNNSRSPSRFLYDVYAGLGLRHEHVFAETVSGIRYLHPVGGQFFDVYRPTNSLSPSVTLGVKVAYSFGKSQR
ncbi:hypothetical protein SAMN06269250_1548 [Spirosoma fluviale]|uniref:Outer membrane protein beta-barrel domain-containing protein n=2 Tax=Spirosoma fluviale TaxID=1597977 RepID=A0A286FBW4_9BACT|nr:hypothetical protein SAMN06269250_1548 [Spirosoma fluviale]